MKRSLLSLFLSAHVLACLAGCDDDRLGNAVTRPFDETRPLAENGSVEIHNINGKIEISTWDKSEVAISGEAFAPSQEHLDRIHLKIDATADTVRIEAVHEKNLLGQSARGGVKFHIIVPESLAKLRASSVNSNIEASNVAAPVKLTTTNGSVTASGLAADAICETVNGGVTLTFNEDTTAKAIRLKSVNGSCSLDVPSDINADVRANSVNGKIKLNVAASSQETSRHSLKARLGSGGTDIEIKTVNGGITIE